MVLPRRVRATIHDRRVVIAASANAGDELHVRRDEACRG